MFGTVRKHSQALWIPIIIVIVVSFVIYFTPGVDPFENRGQAQAETGDGLPFAREQVMFQQALSMASDPQMGGLIPSREYIASRFPPKDLNGDQETDISGLDYQAHLRLMRLRKADSLGIVVSDNMVKARLEQMFTNPNDKRFSTTAYNNFLKQYQTDDGAVRFLAKGKSGVIQFEEFIREEIALGQLDQLMTRSIGFFSEEAIADQLAEENKKYTAQVVFFSTSNRVSEVTNFSTTATNFTEYYQGVADQYFLQPKRKATYVFFSITNYLEEAKEKIKFEELVAKRRNEHNSTNKVHHLTDASGTNKLTGAKLDDALVADVFKSNLIDLEAETLPQAKGKATEFRKKLFVEGKEWSIARLRTEATKAGYSIQSTIVSQANENSILPQTVVDDIFSIPDETKGKLSTSAAEVKSTRFALEESGQGYYVFGLEEVIPGRPRKYQELSKGEQLKVKEGFIEDEAKRLASEEAKDWRDTVTELMATGTSFSNSTKLSKYQIVSLPAMTISQRDVNATALKGQVTLSEIQGALSDLERENRSATKPNWLSSYIATSTEGVGGFIVYVSKVEKGDAPLLGELSAFANRQRQMARSFNSSSMAARFGITPAWLREDINILNQQLVVSALTDRLKNIGFEIEQANSEKSELDKLIGKAKTNPEVLPASVTLEGLKADLYEVEAKLRQLEELKSTLPGKLQEIRQPEAQN